MEFSETSDQEFFRATTRKFLEAECPPAKVRQLGKTADGFEREYWRRGAELGWTSLLIPEELGGGSISGQGVVDLSLVAFEFGGHAAPGPLFGTNVVAAALSRSPSAAHQEVLHGLLTGERVAAWAHPEPLGNVKTEATRTSGGFVLNGTITPVEGGLQADDLLVTAAVDGRMAQFLLPFDSAGVSMTRLSTVDLTRRFAAVHFDSVKVPESAALGAIGRASGDVRWQLQLGLVMQLAQMVGAMQKAFDMTTEWAFNRYSFGRPLASYQELKHRFADMKMWLEASYAIAACAARATEEGTGADEAVSAGKSYVGQYGPELLHDCVQIHGGIGVTSDHDLHLYLRRVTVDVPLYGAPAAHRRRLADIVSEEAR
jgi:alkylation response protein AidB-like acyl-CoA dehydrogenase